MSIEVAGKQIKELRIGVNGQPRVVTEGWVGVNGAPRRFYTASVPLSSFEVGSLVYLKEDGEPVPYIVSGHEYDLEYFTGYTPGKTMEGSVLVRKNAVRQCDFSFVQLGLSSYEIALDQAVKASVAELNSGSISHLLYLEMLGLELSGFMGILGVAKLPNADALKMCNQWLGNMNLKNDGRAYTSSDGIPGIGSPNGSARGLRPVLFLPGETRFDRDSWEFVG